MEINKVAVGQRIKEIRTDLGLSMAKFGELLGDMPRSSVNNWERGINLPKNETLAKIAEVGNTTNEYLLYGDQENQYIMELLEKKLNEADPRFASLIKEIAQQVEPSDEAQMKNFINFLVNNITPLDASDEYSYHLIDKEMLLYLGSIKSGTKAQIYLHFDQDTKIMHIMPFTFSDQSVDRLLIFLNTGESLHYFDGKLPAEMKQKPIMLYYFNERINDLAISALVYSAQSKSYQVAQSDKNPFKGQGYMTFVEELFKETLLRKELADKD
jgi:transcriptional regulator with XRE-family HTH domain